MDTFAVYLRPQGSLHSDVHSGTLFGALCWAIQILDLADLPAMLEDFNADPPFVISSAFPCLSSDEGRVHFYPFPLLPPLTSDQVDRLAEEDAGKRGGNPKDARWRVIERAKDLKGVRYVSEALLGDIVTGEADAAALLRRWRTVGTRPDDVEFSKGMLLTTGERKSLGIEGRLKPLLKDQDVQRNQIDRVSGATVEGLLFFEHQTFLRHGLTGLWFLLRTRRRELVEAALRYLADTGIGGGRSTGKGQFDIEVESPLPLPEVERPNAFVALSFYLPREGDWEAEGEPLSYRLINFRGKHESSKPTPLAEGHNSQPVYKELVRPFAAGSIFPLQEQRPWYGRIARVGRIGEREVWQNGMALPVFARIGGDA